MLLRKYRVACPFAVLSTSGLPFSSMLNFSFASATMYERNTSACARVADRKIWLSPVRQASSNASCAKNQVKPI